MSKGKGFGGKTPAKTEASTTASTAVPKLSTPETAMADIGEHYFHAATEQAPAGQYVNTHTAIVDYVYTKTYKETAMMMDAGEELPLSIPTPPTKESIVLEEVTGADEKPTTMVFDATAPFEDDDDDLTADTKGVKDETDVTAAQKEEEREQIYQTLLEVHKKEIDLYVKSKSKLKEGKDFAIRCIWAQCSTSMKAVLLNRKGFSASRKASDVLAVLDHVKTACYDFNVAGNPYNIYWHALYRLMNTRQRKNEDGHSFRERLLTAIKRFEQVGGSMSRLIEVDKADPEMSDVKHTRMVMQNLAAMMQFQQCDNERYGKLKTEYYNNRLAGNDMYPSSWNQAATLLDNYKSEPKTEAYSAPPGQTQGGAKSFLTTAGTGNGDNTFTIPAGHATGTDGSYHPRIQCNGCEKYGHYVRNCPTHPDPAPGGGKGKDDEDGGDGEKSVEKKTRFKAAGHYILGNNKEVIQYDECVGDEDSDYGGEGRLKSFSYAQVARGARRKHAKMFTEDELKGMGVNCTMKGSRGKMRIMVLLDSGASDHIIKDKELLIDIKHTPNDVLDVETNGGNYVVNQKGTLPGVGTVWYSPESVINVLSLKHMNAHTDYKVDYHGEDEKPHFLVRNLRSDVVTKFGEVGDIYIHTIEVGGAKKSSLTNSKTGQSYSSSAISTVEANKKLYSKRQVRNADKVKPLLAMLSYPSKKDLITMIRNRVISNCPLTENDVRRYFEIYGNNEGSIKGKATRKRPEHVTTESLVTIPEEILREHRTLTLYADLFFISGMPYFTTISEGIMFTTVEALQNRKYDTIIDALLAVITFYKVKGFNVKFVFSDNELKPMKEAIHEEGNADLNLSAPNEHVPEVERNIKTIKERVRCSINDMPYEKLPKNFKRELVTTCCSMLNALPRSAGVSQVYSPREIVTGKRLDFKKHCKIAPGDYCLVHEERLTTNTMQPRASRAVAIGISSNMQGAYQFLMLDTGSIVTRRSWDKLAVTDDVKLRMHELAGVEDKHMEFEYHANYYNTADNDVDAAAEQDDDSQQAVAEAETEVATAANEDVAAEQDDAPPNQEDIDLINELDPLGNDFGEADNFVPDDQGRRVRRSRRVAGVEPAPVMPEEQSHPNEDNEATNEENEATSNFTDGRMKAKRPTDPYERDKAVGKVYFQMVKDTTGGGYHSNGDYGVTVYIERNRRV